METRDLPKRFTEVECKSKMSILPPKPDTWNGLVEYKKHIKTGLCPLIINFSKVSLKKCNNLPVGTLTLFLDDTSNEKNGCGNTRMLELNQKTHSDGVSGDMHMSDVMWPLMGAFQVDEEDPRKKTVFAMPNVAKVVVTGETPLMLSPIYPISLI